MNEQPTKPPENMESKSQKKIKKRTWLDDLDDEWSMSEAEEPNSDAPFSWDDL